MHHDHEAHSNPWWHGPRVWAACALVGGLLGIALAFAIPGSMNDHGPVVQPWLVAPFVLLLLSIAVMPFINVRWWHRHYPDFAFFLGSLVAAYYLVAFPSKGHAHSASASILHAVEEYYAFIGLVGSLYVVSGAILVDLRGKATPLRNGALMLFGAIVANLVGTTGASALLIRPFLRMNASRPGGVRALHVVMFIFIVSNCGGCLTPIGDPPLYIGFIKGIPFQWTLQHLWPDWLAVVLPLVAIFVAIDARFVRKDRALAAASTAAPPPAQPPLSLSIRGRIGMVGLFLVLVGVFVDPMLDRFAGFHGFPVGATLQIAVALAVYFKAPRAIYTDNDFTFEPIKEVGLLFVGIFLTMTPALGLMADRGSALGLKGASSYYFASGTLSAVLDNAPTYLNFLQLAMAPEPISKPGLAALLATPAGHDLVRAISTGAVFFGAMTYIGNGPNFMVRAIAESAGVKMPSFFGYVGYAVLILLPVLVLHWAMMVR